MVHILGVTLLSGVWHHIGLWISVDAEVEPSTKPFFFFTRLPIDEEIVYALTQIPDSLTQINKLLMK